MNQAQPKCGLESLQSSGDAAPVSRVFTWADYNIAKLEWLRDNRGASGAELEAASRRIAEDMGL